METGTHQQGGWAQRAAWGRAVRARRRPVGLGGILGFALAIGLSLLILIPAIVIGLFALGVASVVGAFGRLTGGRPRREPAPPDERENVRVIVRDERA